MPKVNIYVPADLLEAARARGLALSSIAQEAIAARLRAGQNDEWIRRQSGRPASRRRIDTSALIEKVRADFG